MKPTQQDPAWLRTLHALDQKVARRWMSDPGGAARLRRIASAMVAKGKRGHPPVPRAQLVMQAATLWMTDVTVDTFLQASKLVTQRVFVEAERKPEIRMDLPTPLRLIRQIREQLQQGSSEFWVLAEKEAVRLGLRVMRSPNDESDDPRVLFLQRKMSAVEGQLALAVDPTLQNIFDMMEAIDQMPVSRAIRLLGDAANAWAATREDVR